MVLESYRKTTATDVFIGPHLAVVLPWIPEGPPPPPPPPPPPGDLAGLARIPWEGADYWAQFPLADAAGWSDPSFFPVSVFLGNPVSAAGYQAVGVNTYQGVEHSGDLTPITDIGMFALPHAGEWTSTEIGSNPLAVGHFASDECEMGQGSCDPGVLTGTAAEEFSYNTQVSIVNGLRARDDGRFVDANFGNGVLGTFWAPNRMDDHLALMDAAGVDKYAYTSPGVRFEIGRAPRWPAGTTDADIAKSATYGWLADQLTFYSNPDDLRPRGVFVEVAKPYLFGSAPDGSEPGSTTITPDQIEGAVWSAIIHECRWLCFFDHNNDATNGARALIDGTTDRKTRVAAVTAKIRDLAPVLNTQSYVWDFGATGIDTMLKTHGGYAYVFAGVGISGVPGSTTFTLPADVTGTSVDVLYESRSLTVTSSGQFTDSFAAEYSVHIYKVAI